MSADIWRKIEQEFRLEGFMAPLAEHFRTHFRDKMALWFELAEQLNRLAHRSYTTRTVLLHGRRVTDPKSLLLLIMPRCLSAFQGAILLAERGMGIEAQALVRHVFESAFWMGYITRFPTEAEAHLRWETLHSEIGHFEAAERHLHGVQVEVRIECKRQLEEMRRERSVLPRSPAVEQIAILAGVEQNYYFYKDLSGAATHLSLKSVHGFLNHDNSGQVVGHQIGPDEAAVGKSVWLGCRALCLAVDFLQQSMEDVEQQAELSQLSRRMSELEPYTGS